MNKAYQDFEIWKRKNPKSRPFKYLKELEVKVWGRPWLRGLVFQGQGKWTLNLGLYERIESMPKRGHQTIEHRRKPICVGSQ